MQKHLSESMIKKIKTKQKSSIKRFVFKILYSIYNNNISPDLKACLVRFFYASKPLTSLQPGRALTVLFLVT